jgi:hypothetical protein
LPEETSNCVEEVRQPGEAVRISEGERIVADIGIPIPALRVGWIGHGRIRAGHAREQRVIDAPVQMHEAADRELLLAGEAARGLTGDAAGGIVGAVRVAPLAPGVIAQPLHHEAVLVGDDRDRAEMIREEVARRQRGGRHLQGAHAPRIQQILNNSGLALQFY